MKITAKQFIRKHQKSFTLENFKRWGAMGAKARKSHRRLTSAEAKRMVGLRKKNPVKII